MIEIEINDAVIIEQRNALEALSTNPETVKKLREVIRQLIRFERLDLQTS
jgi:hypothetical protein